MELKSNSFSCCVDGSQNPILKPSLGDNLIVLQTPVHKNLKVRFQTPSRTPLSTLQNSNLVSKFNTTNLTSLDEEDRWKERIEVVTKFDHEEYTKSAQLFIEEILNNVVAYCNQKINAKQNNSSDSTKVKLESKNDATCLSNVSQDSFEVIDLDDKENILPEDECLFAPFKNKERQKSDSTFPKGPAVGSSPTSNKLSSIESGSTMVADFDRNNFSTKTYEASPHLTTLFSIFQGEKNSQKGDALPSNDSLHCTKKVGVGRENISAEKPLDETVKKSDNFTSTELQQLNTSLGDDIFQDAAVLVERGFDFDLDFLENKGSDGITSDLRKQSLYLKFDPLVAAENTSESRGLIGRKSDIIDLCGHVGLPHFTQEPISNKAANQQQVEQQDLLCASPSSYAKGDRESQPEVRAELEQQEVRPDAMKSTSKETWLSARSHVEAPGIVELLKYTDADVDKIKEPLLKQIASLNKKLASSDDKLATQAERIEQMQVVLEEFEATVVEMAQKFEQEKNKLEMEKTEIIVEQEKTVNHLESVEKAYLELLQRSEQMKKGIGNYKINEETYKNVISEYQTAQEAAQQRYKALKATMEETQTKLETDFNAERKELRSQLSALKARCKFLENQAKSLQLQLDQKTSENSELTKICDELIEQQQSTSSS